MRKCRFCAEEIQDAAIVCKHCGRDLVGSRGAAPTKVAVTQIDPFVAYHTNIQGKKTGRITVVGYLGIGVGVVSILAAGLAMSSGPDAAGPGMLMVLFGTAFIVASYLWVRR